MAANNGDVVAIQALVRLEGHLQDVPSQDGTTAMEISYGHGYMDIYNLLKGSAKLLLGCTIQPIEDYD